MKKFKIIITLSMIAFIFVALFYPIAVFTDIPFIQKWRTIYIETAMTTYTHKWLATAFIPGFVIDDVMNTNYEEELKQQSLSTSWDIIEPEDTISEEELALLNAKSSEELFYKTYWELDTDSFKSFIGNHPKFIEDGYENLFIDNSNYKYDIKSTLDERVYLIDAKNNLIIFEVTGNGFVGKLATIKDSSQVMLAKSKTLNSYGTLLRDFYTQNDALLTINCSGFGDEDEKGNGSTVMGSLIIDGKEYGHPNYSYFLFGQKEDEKFYIEKYSDADTSDYKWAAQFKPALVINGDKVVNGSYGYGIQPRSAIGQSANNEFLLLIVDGRQVGYSIGATVSDLADVLLEHNAYQAVNLDGGSSSLMWYDGKNITKPSSTNYLGRYLPNAIIVNKAK